MRVLESYDVTPNTNILDILGHSGYNLQSAIADIIDNSITAKSSDIWLNFNYDKDNSYITIVDNGIGMDLEKLKQASIIAFQNINEIRGSYDLGRFSTGINSASASVCNHLFIQSKAKGKDRNTIQIDFNKMRAEGWICNVVDIEEDYLRNSGSGTAIVWKDLHSVANFASQANMFKKLEIVEHHLSHVFNDYIKKGLKIHINDGYDIPGWDPFFTQNSGTTEIYNRPVPYGGSQIGVKIYILPPYNNLSVDDQAYMRGYGLSEQQGFYIYRNERLIKEGGWLNLNGFTISNKYDYARIRVDVNSSLDNVFNPNFLKNELIIPDDLTDYFIHIAKIARRESHSSFNYMKAPSVIRKVKSNKSIPVWNTRNSKEGLQISVNEDHPLIASLTAQMDSNTRKRLFKLLAKNIPFGDIQHTGMPHNQYSTQNIEDDMNDMYVRLINDGLSQREIMEKMCSCEPFCSNEEYITMILEFFEKKGAFNDVNRR